MGSAMQAYTSLKGEVWVYKTWLTMPLVIEVFVPSHECEQPCMCVLGVLMLFLSTILVLLRQCGIVFWYCSDSVVLYFGIAQTVWYCILVLLRQCSILFWYCSDSVVFYFGIAHSVVFYFSLHYMVNRLADVYALNLLSLLFSAIS
jgi:hypothetical protein